MIAVGGAKLSLQFFSLDDLVDDKNDSIPVTFLGWGRSPEKAMIDHRINTVKATPIQFEIGNNSNDVDEDKQHLIAAGDSNGSLYLYKVSQTPRLSSSCNIGMLAFRSSRPILSLEFLVAQTKQNATILLLLVGTTAGTVHLIDVSEAAVTRNSLEQAVVASTFPVTPLANYQAHAMGVNAISAARRVHSLPPLGHDSLAFRFLVCSGGDDQALCCATIVVRLFQAEGNNQPLACDKHEAGRFNVEVTDLRKVEQASASALKGVHWIDETHFVSVGYSQRLELWQYGRQSMDRVASIDAEVGDVCCLAACHETRGGDEHFIMAVGGAGVEFFSLPIKCMPP